MSANALAPNALAEHWRVLHIAPTPFFADYGCHVRIYEETRALVRRGHEVTIVTYHIGGDVAGLDVRRFLNIPSRRRIKVGSSRRKFIYDPLLAMQAIRVALQMRPSIVHAHLHDGALIGALVSRILRVPLVFDFQGSMTSEMLDHRFITPGSPLVRLFRTLETLINRFPAAIVTSSHNAADMLIHDFGIEPARVATVADAVDPTTFIPRWEHPDPDRIQRLRDRLGIPVHRPVVAYLGLLAEYQGTSKLLEAAAELTRRGVDAHYLVMGFPGVDTYSLIARNLGVADRVTFTDRVPYFDAPDHLLVGDIAVSPKMSETEGNGKLLNYAAVGLPVVAFGTPVAREILGEFGVYAAHGDVGSLADCLQRLIEDPAERERLGRALRNKMVAEQSWHDRVEQVLKVYRTVAPCS